MCVNPKDGTIANFGESISVASKITATDSLGSDRKFSDVILGPLGLHLYLIPATARYVIKMNILEVSLSLSLYSHILYVSFNFHLKRLFLLFLPHHLFFFLSLHFKPNMAYMLPCLVWKKGSWEALGGDLGYLEWKWGKGVLCGDKIFCSPHNSNRYVCVSVWVVKLSFLN
jgi:hypothetical protein